jgi:hypothetical protein
MTRSYPTWRRPATGSESDVIPTTTIRISIMQDDNRGSPGGLESSWVHDWLNGRSWSSPFRCGQISTRRLFSNTSLVVITQFNLSQSQPTHFQSRSSLTPAANSDWSRSGCPEYSNFIFRVRLSTHPTFFYNNNHGRQPNSPPHPHSFLPSRTLSARPPRRGRAERRAHCGPFVTAEDILPQAVYGIERYNELPN